jgi:hypothetical protein
VLSFTIVSERAVAVAIDTFDLKTCLKAENSILVGNDFSISLRRDRFAERLAEKQFRMLLGEKAKLGVLLLSAVLLADLLKVYADARTTGYLFDLVEKNGGVDVLFWRTAQRAEGS